jgi:hypothetical protein
MKLQKFISLMLPTFEKGRLTEELQVVRNEIKEITLPPLREASEFYRVGKLKSKQALNYDKNFLKIATVEKASGNYLNVSYMVLATMEEKLEVLGKMIDRAFAKDVGSSSISFLRANILQYLEVASFSSRYARRLLLWSLSEEQDSDNSPFRLPKAMSKAEERWIWDNRENYAKCLAILAINTSKMQSSFGAVPDMVVAPDDIPAVEATVGTTKTDPFHFGIIPVRLNPIYYIRMSIAEWQVSRYKAAVEEKRALEYRLLALKDGGKGDAKLEQEIAYTEGRVQKLNKKIAEMEEGYND